MSAATLYRMTKFGGVAPNRGTLPLAANTAILGGTLVAIDASGRAVAPTDGDNLRVLGVAEYTVDNRTGSEYGGTAGAVNIDVLYGLFDLVCADTDLVPGDVVYVVDNQTVSKSDNGGTRGIAGIFCETGADSKKYFLVGPMVASIVGAAKRGVAHIPLNSLRVAAGTMPAAFNDGVADGFVVNEGPMYRFNVNSTTVVWANVALPDDLDETRDIVVHALVSREGSSDTDAVLTVGAFFQTVGAAYTADATAGGATDAIDSATTIVKEVTRTIAAADVPAGACGLSLSLVPSAALNADDLNLHALWVTYTKKG
jgi:hypothetical protein